MNLNGINFYYESYGNGKPLILIAGYQADTTVWQSVIPQLSKKHQVIVFDNRGAGFSDVPPGPYNVDLMAEDVSLLIDALELPQKPHIYGNSMGGAIAQTVAYRYPDKVDKVVISNSSSCFNQQLKYIAKYYLSKCKTNHDPIEQASLWLPLVFSSQFIAKSDNVKLYFDIAQHHPKPMTVAGIEAQLAALEQFDSTAWLHEINKQCLILNADEDILCLPKETEILRKAIKNSQSYTFENCGHLPHVEYPDLAVEVVERFLCG